MVAAVAGMTLGIVMGATHDFTLAPAHAHLNLLGWVSMTLFGLYYRGSAAAAWRIARVQVGISLVGAWAMPVGLALMLGAGNEAAISIVFAGSILAFAGMVLFAGIVLAEIRQRTAVPLARAFESG